MLVGDRGRVQRACGGVSFDTAGFLQISTGLVMPTFGTLAGWVYTPSTIPSNWAVASVFLNGDFGSGLVSGNNAGGTSSQLATFASGGGAIVATLTTNTWWYFAISMGATNTVGYAKPAGADFASSTRSSTTGFSGALLTTIGNNGSFNNGGLSGVFAGWKVWTRALTEDELIFESEQLAPRTGFGLFAYLPMRGGGSVIVDEWRPSNAWTKSESLGNGGRQPPVPEYRTRTRSPGLSSSSTSPIAGAGLGQATSAGALAGAGSLLAAVRAESEGRGLAVGAAAISGAASAQASPLSSIAGGVAAPASTMGYGSSSSGASGLASIAGAAAASSIAASLASGLGSVRGSIALPSAASGALLGIGQASGRTTAEATGQVTLGVVVVQIGGATAGQAMAAGGASGLALVLGAATGEAPAFGRFASPGLVGVSLGQALASAAAIGVGFVRAVASAQGIGSSLPLVLRGPIRLAASSAPLLELSTSSAPLLELEVDLS